MTNEELIKVIKSTKIKEKQMAYTTYLIKQNIKLINKIVNKYLKYGSDFEDLQIEGIRGLIRAIKTFKPSKKNKFITYAYFWVENFIQRFSNDDKIIREPITLTKKGKKQNNFINEKVRSWESYEDLDKFLESELNSPMEYVSEIELMQILSDKLKKLLTEDEFNLIIKNYGLFWLQKKKLTKKEQNAACKIMGKLRRHNFWFTKLREYIRGK